MLGLNAKTLSALTDRLKTLLPKVVINDGKFIEYHSLLALEDIDRVLPSSGDYKKRLEKYIEEEGGASHFFSEMIYTAAANEGSFQPDKSDDLTILRSFSNIDLAAENLAREFESLPRVYRVFYPLPEHFGEMLAPGESEFVLSDDTKLVRIMHDTIADFPTETEHPVGGLASLFGLGVTGLGDALAEGKVVFVTRVEGYIGKYSVSEPLRRAESRLRSFLGLCIAIRAMKFTNRYVPMQIKQSLLVQRIDDLSPAICRHFDLDDDFSKMASQIQVEDFGGHFENVPQLYTAERLKQMSHAFLATEASDRLQLAARWYFDSLSNNRELLAFVQAMVCLEIVLGGQSGTEDNRVGEAIRNRCSYLIGTSPEDREKIATDLKTIYRVRSNIVHTGKESLSKSEREMMYRLRGLCAAVLQKELELAATASRLRNYSIGSG